MIKTPCAAAPEGVPDVLRFSYLNASTSVYGDCGQSIQLALNSTLIQSFVGGAALGEVTRIEEHSSSTLIERVAHAQLVIAEAQMLAVLHRMRLIAARNISFPGDGGTIAEQLGQFKTLIDDASSSAADVVPNAIALKGNMSASIYNGTGDLLPGADALASYELAAQKQQQMSDDSRTAIASMIAQQRAIPAKLDNALSWAKSSATVWQTMVTPGMQNFTAAMIAAFNRTVLPQDLVAAWMKASAEEGIDKDAISRASDLFSNPPWSVISGMFGDSQFGRITSTIVVLSAGLILLTASPLLFYWACLRLNRTISVVGPFSSAKAFEVDRKYTEMLHKSHRGGYTRVSTELASMPSPMSS
jgi:hypothetical protein